mgnify:CR=1 FL=1
MMTATATLFDYAAEPVAATACPVCGRDNPSRPATDRYGFAIGLSACASCGLRYLNPRMSADQYMRFYQTAYRPLVDAYCATDTTGERAIKAATRRALLLAERVRSRVTRPVTSLLDVGGGTGTVARVLSNAFRCPSVTVLDPNAEDVAVAESRGCHGIVGTIETLPPPTQTYDLIVCLQTADHWLDPIAALTWMRQALAPGGHLWIDIVDEPEFAKVQPQVCLWKIDHPLYWSTGSLLLALQRTGWRAREMAHWTRDGQAVRYRPGFWCEGV